MQGSVIRALAILVGGAAFGGPVARAQTTATFTRLQPGNTVEILDLRKGQWHRVYRSSSWGLTDLTVAPSGDRLALLSWTEGVVSGHDYSVPPSPELVVLDTLGRKLAAVPKVQRYDWCGPGCLIYITGEYEESDIGFLPGGVGMLDVATGKTTALPAPSSPTGITWGKIDSAAYVKNAGGPGEARIYRIDIVRRTMAPTELLDHQFSPTGRYYLHRPVGADSFAVYETRTNAPVDVSTLQSEARVIGWASSSEDVLLATRKPAAVRADPGDRIRVKPLKQGALEQSYQLYRLSDRRTVLRSKGQLDQGSGPGHLRLVRQGRNYKVLDGR
jgi:hypothetical protein